jgi:hypothetical protein
VDNKAAQLQHDVSEGTVASGTTESESLGKQLDLTRYANSVCRTNWNPHCHGDGFLDRVK